MTMNCKQARMATALWAGGDLEDDQTAALESHRAECPQCRSHAENMKQAMASLEQADSRSADTGHTSLWPKVQAALVHRRRRARVRRFNYMVAGFSIAATVVAMISISQDPPSDPGYMVVSEHTTPAFVGSFPSVPVSGTSDTDLQRSNSIELKRLNDTVNELRREGFARQSQLDELIRLRTLVDELEERRILEMKQR